jgi:hypothetical protein
MTISVGGKDNTTGYSTYPNVHETTLDYLNQPKSNTQQYKNTNIYADNNITNLNSLNLSNNEILLNKIKKICENSLNNDDVTFNSSNILYNSFIKCAEENIKSNDKISDFDETLRKISNNLNEYSTIENDINKIIIETINKRLDEIELFKIYVKKEYISDYNADDNNKLLNNAIEAIHINEELELSEKESLTYFYKLHLNKNQLDIFLNKKEQKKVNDNDFDKCTMVIYYILKIIIDYIQQKLNYYLIKENQNFYLSFESTIDNLRYNKEECYKYNNLLYEYYNDLKEIYLNYLKYLNNKNNMNDEELKSKLETHENEYMNELRVMNGQPTQPIKPTQGGKRKTQKKKPKSKTQKKLKNKNKKSKKNKR